MPRRAVVAEAPGAAVPIHDFAGGAPDLTAIYDAFLERLLGLDAGAGHPVAVEPTLPAPEPSTGGLFDETVMLSARVHPGLRQQAKRYALEVWLTERDLEMLATVVRPDETTELLAVESRTMRGAQRELTGYLLDAGWEPAGPLEQVAGRGSEALEAMRRFEPRR